MPEAVFACMCTVFLSSKADVFCKNTAAYIFVIVRKKKSLPNVAETDRKISRESRKTFGCFYPLYYCDWTVAEKCNVVK